ncbi:MAG: hypothetical protein AAFQ10_02625 [Pseudomonadota bacterium]
MAHNFQFVEDEEPLARTAQINGKEHVLIDGYSQWKLDFGRHFEATENDPYLMARDPDIDVSEENQGSFADIIADLTTTVSAGVRATLPPPLFLQLQIQRFGKSAITSAPNAYGESFTLNGIGNGLSPAPSNTVPGMVVPLPLHYSSIDQDYDDKNAPVPGGKDFASLLKDEKTVPDKDRMVVVGVIDDGINITHRRFRDHQGRSRIDHAWVQDAPHNNCLETEAKKVSTVPYGREVTRCEIEQKLKEAQGDERAALKALGFLPEPGSLRPTNLNQRVTHGTAVMDLAAGYDADDKRGVNHRIVAVQLPPAATRDTSGASLTSFARNAALFIFARARAMSARADRPLPVVLNFSFGFAAGPHDGRFILERIMRHASLQYRLWAEDKFGTSTAAIRVVPAGNTALAQLHAVGDVYSEDKKSKISTLKTGLRLQPGDRTSSHVEIYIPQSSKGGLFRLTTPDGQSFDATFDDWAMQTAYNLTRDGELIGRLYLETIFPNDDKTKKRDLAGHRILLSFAPTDTSSFRKRKLTPTPAGLWHLEVHAQFDEKPSPIRAWVQRDDPFGSVATGARQAYFDDPTYEEDRFEKNGAVRLVDQEQPKTTIRRSGSLSGLATNPREGTFEMNKGEDEMLDLVVATGITANTSVVSYAGAASTNTALNIEAPNVAAVVERSRVQRSILTRGTFGDSIAPLNGTSLAAPQVARQIARALSRMDDQQRASVTPARFLSGMVRKAELVSTPDQIDDNKHLARPSRKMRNNLLRQ